MCRTGRMACGVVLATVVTAVGMGGEARAQDGSRAATTRESVLAWAAQHRDATPDFRPGDVLTHADLEKVRPFLPPGYIEEMDFPDVEFTISETGDYAPHPAFLAATEQYAGQTGLADDGALVDYVAGQPFPTDSLTLDDPTAGWKLAWNFNYRWQHFGQRTRNLYIALVKEGGDAIAPVGVPDGFLTGGGTFERVLVEAYQRVYFTHVATLAAQNFLLAAPNAADFEWKDYLEFTAPYDVRGQRMVVQRAADPHLTDQAWSYVPSLRRVRRLSAEEKADSFLGTESTLDDFYGFSGRVLEHDWKFHGTKSLLHVMNSRHAVARYSGPHSRVPHDRWELRPCFILEQIPKKPNYPYSSKLLFIDTQTYNCTSAVAFDREGKLWKLWNHINSWSEDAQDLPEQNKGTHVARFLGVATIDVKNRRATMLTAQDTDYPPVQPDEADELFNLNKLTEGRR